MDRKIYIRDKLAAATTEMLVLSLLCERDCYISEIAQILADKSGDQIKLLYPYSVFVCLYIPGYASLYQTAAPDGCKRSLFRITESGKQRYQMLKKAYDEFIEAAAKILS